MAVNKKTYLYTGFATLAAGANFLYQFYLRSTQRKIVVNKILITWQLLDNVTGLLIPWESNTTQIMYFTMGQVGYLMADKFDGAPATGTDSAVFYCFTPGIYDVSKFEFKNENLIRIGMSNNSANQTGHIFSLSITTEDHIIY